MNPIQLPNLKNPYFHQILQVSIFSLTFFISLYIFSLTLSSIFYIYQYKNPLTPIYPPICYAIFSSIYIPQYERTWYGISPLVKPPCIKKVLFFPDIQKEDEHTGTSLRQQYHSTWVHIGGYIMRKKLHNILGDIYGVKGFYIGMYKKWSSKLRKKYKRI